MSKGLQQAIEKQDNQMADKLLQPINNETIQVKTKMKY